MNITPGHITVFISFITALAATALFADGFRSRQRQQETAGRGSRGSLAYRVYLAMTASGLLTSAILMYLILSHSFDYAYVVKYSSRDLPLLYLISSFWAGQEGTFLLWAVMVSVMGVVLYRQTGDRPAMALVSGYTAFLFLLLLIKSPFENLGFTQPDGSGLNPLLQDPWMVIHPPILFMGYAAATFPFALAISALGRKTYTNWFRFGFSWTLFASLSLGAGIIIGGFWAYEVLGWGGYWGWDPVENSSLVPWLTLLALVHGLVVQKAKGSLVRTNILLAIISFLLVTYATFLTRSGVLADFSVHSFVDLGINTYLIGIMGLTVLVGIGFFVIRFRTISSPGIDATNLNRELTLLVSLYVIGTGALFTFAGMSSPIFTGFFGKASQVDTSFYNRVNLPVAIAISLLLGITPFLGWKEDSFRTLLKRFSLPLMLTGLSVLIAWVAGVTTVSLMVFTASAAFALISNSIVMFRQYRSGWLANGGPISHIGVALLLIGIIGSGSFDESHKLVLKEGQPQSVFGYTVTFSGISDADAVKPKMTLDVTDGRTSYVATPKLYYSQYNRSTMREPDIRILPLKDLYISPLELRSSIGSADNPTFEIGLNDTASIGPYSVRFIRFESGEHMRTGSMSVGAILAVTTGGRTDTVMPALTFDEQGNRNPLPADMPVLTASGGTPPQIALTAISVEQKMVRLQMVTGRELVVDISTKPLMMVVWTGVVLIIAGTFMAWRRRTTAAEG